SRTIRTARSRTSGEYLGHFFFVFSIAPFSQEVEPPEIPGRFSLHSNDGRGRARQEFNEALTREAPLKAGLPAASRPTTWNADLPMSIPILATADVTR
ncbi:hypothetical protein, partial [Paraburkholderia sp. BR14320]|uniref:hypothetical protein n=1 Tax=unclassified Paraburkholderia TaxID=2615204 RepID=UPI0034CE6911